MFGTLLINLGKISLYLNTPTPYSLDPSSLSLTPKPLKSSSSSHLQCWCCWQISRSRKAHKAFFPQTGEFPVQVWPLLSFVWNGANITNGDCLSWWVGYVHPHNENQRCCSEMFGNYKSRMNSTSWLALYSEGPEGSGSWCESTFIYEERLFVCFVSFVIGISMKLHKKWFWKEKFVA